MPLPRPCSGSLWWKLVCFAIVPVPHERRFRILRVSRGFDVPRGRSKSRFVAAADFGFFAVVVFVPLSNVPVYRVGVLDSWLDSPFPRGVAHWPCVAFEDFHTAFAIH